MANQQQGAAAVLAEGREFGHHLAGHGRIQAGGGFIGNHQGRLQRHGQGDRQPLAHAATELVGIAGVAIGANADPGQQGLGPPPDRPALAQGPSAEKPRSGETSAVGAGGWALVGREGVGQVLPNRHQRVEPGHRVLEHQAHGPTAQPPQVPLTQPPRILAGQLQAALAAAAGGKQLQNGPGHRALAAARGSHQGQALAGLEHQIEAVEGGHGRAGIVNQQLLQAQDRSGRPVGPERSGGGRFAGRRSIGWRSAG